MSALPEHVSGVTPIGKPPGRAPPVPASVREARAGACTCPPGTHLLGCEGTASTPCHARHRTCPRPSVYVLPGAASPAPARDLRRYRWPAGSRRRPGGPPRWSPHRRPALLGHGHGSWAGHPSGSPSRPTARSSTTTAPSRPQAWRRKTTAIWTSSRHPARLAGLRQTHTWRRAAAGLADEARGGRVHHGAGRPRATTPRARHRAAADKDGRPVVVRVMVLAGDFDRPPRTVTNGVDHAAPDWVS